MQDILIGFLTMLANLLIVLFPSFSLENNVITTISSSISIVLDMFKSANSLIPVVDIFLIISIIVTYRLTMFTFFCVNWIIKRVRGG